ncbi:MAG: TlpA disulfide reductase family protein [Candidatus Omnitrophica bacterium]|nr:TlpA disulfide reductase family protein [Candidatus Omnitrophota bacterium]
MRKNHKLAGIIVIAISILILVLFYFFSGDSKTLQPSLKKTIDFTLSDLKGNEISLSGMKGKVVLLTFWSTRCRLCQKEVALLKKIHGIYDGKRVEILAVDVGESDFVVKRFKSDEGIAYRILLDREAFVARIYGVMGVPTDIIVDREGVVRYYGFGWPDNLEEIINSLL